MSIFRYLFIPILLFLSGCFVAINNNPDAELSVTVNIPLPEINTENETTNAQPITTNTPIPDDLPFGLRNENKVMGGICFESAADAAGRVFVLRNAEDHIRFYNLADNSDLCRRPVRRNPFDFTSGRILAGTWNYGIGCTARHEIIDLVRDNVANTITIRVRFLIDGACPYELVRPFWVSLPDVGESAVNIIVLAE